MIKFHCGETIKLSGLLCCIQKLREGRGLNVEGGCGEFEDFMRTVNRW